MKIIIKKIEAVILDAGTPSYKDYIIQRYTIEFMVFNEHTSLTGEFQWDKDLDIPEIEQHILSLFKNF